ncbi:hypothetical protein MUNTM_58150 [Mycobacterium sp. MUNTM1]
MTLAPTLVTAPWMRLASGTEGRAAPNSSSGAPDRGLVMGNPLKQHVLTLDDERLFGYRYPSPQGLPAPAATKRAVSAAVVGYR